LKNGKKLKVIKPQNNQKIQILEALMYFLQKPENQVIFGGTGENINFICMLSKLCF